MPPSGYSHAQSEYAVDFLSSCFQALVNEAEEKSVSLFEALSMEIGNIKSHLRSENSKTAQEAILRLTLTFYEALFTSGQADDEAIRRLAPMKARHIGSEILEIRVDEKAYASI